MSQRPVRVRRLNRIGLRERVVIALAVALSPIIILGSSRALTAQQQTRDALHRNLADDAREGLVKVNSALQGARTALGLISNSQPAPSCAEIGGQLTAMELPVLNAVRFDPGGKVACSFIGESLAGQSLPDAGWNQSLRMGVQQIETSRYADLALSEPVIWILRRTEDADGRFTGSAGLTIGLRQLAGLMPDFNQASGFEQALVTAHDGAVIGSDIIERLPPEWLSSEALMDRSIRHLVLRQGRRIDVLILPVASQGVFLITASPSPLGQTFETLIALSIALLAYLAVLLGTLWIIDLLVLRWLERLRLAISYGQSQGAITPIAAELAGAPAELRQLASIIDDLSSLNQKQETDLKTMQALLKGAFRETHHRVKNNLQVMLSMLKLQTRGAEDAEAQAELRVAAQRVSLMAAVHHSLLNETDPETVDARDLIEAICDHIQEQHSWGDDSPQILAEIGNGTLPSNLGVALAMFIQEAIHLLCPVSGGSEGMGDLELSLNREGDCLRLRLSCGRSISPAGQFQGELRTSLFLTAFARQLEGSFEQTEDIPDMATIELVFPLIRQKQP